MCGEGKVSAKLANRPRLRSASPRAEIKVVDQSIVGGRGFGINAQYPLGARKTRPGDELEKSLGSICIKSANKDIHYCHFIPKVQIKQLVSCTLLTFDDIIPLDGDPLLQITFVAVDGSWAEPLRHSCTAGSPERLSKAAGLEVFGSCQSLLLPDPAEPKTSRLAI